LTHARRMVNRQAIQEDTRFADIRRDVTQFVGCVTLSAQIADALKPLSATGCTPRGVRRCQKMARHQALCASECFAAHGPLTHKKTDAPSCDRSERCRLAHVERRDVAAIANLEAIEGRWTVVIGSRLFEPTPAYAGVSTQTTRGKYLRLCVMRPSRACAQESVRSALDALVLAGAPGGASKAPMAVFCMLAHIVWMRIT